MNIQKRLLCLAFTFLCNTCFFGAHADADLKVLEELYDESSHMRWEFKRHFHEKRRALCTLRNTCSRWVGLLHMLQTHLHYSNLHGRALQEKYNITCTLVAVIDDMSHLIKREEVQLQKMRRLYMRLRQNVYALQYKICALRHEQ